MQLVVDVEQSSSALTYATDPGAINLTRVFFLLNAPTASNPATFADELGSSYTALVPFPHLHLFFKALSWSLIEATPLGAARFGVSTNTSLIMAGVGVYVVVVSMLCDPSLCRLRLIRFA